MFIHDFKQLSIFHVLATTGSFTKTAQRVNLSQGAVSYAIKALEMALECKLVNRSTKRFTLTKEGEVLLKHIVSIEHRLSLAEEEMKSMKGSLVSENKLKVGASVATSTYFIEKIWPKLKGGYPDVELELKPGDTTKLLDLLRNGSIDFLFGVNVKKQTLGKAFVFHELFVDEKVFVFNPKHSWAREPIISNEHITKQTIISGTRHEPTKKLIDDYILSMDEPLSHFVEACSIRLQKEMLKMNMGVGIASPFMYSDELDSGELLSVEIPSRPIIRSWGVIVRSDYDLKPVEQEMVRLLIQSTKVFRDRYSHSA